MAGDAYKQAGVDIDAADRMIDRIKPLAKATHRPGVLGSLGGFGGLFHLQGNYKDPVLVSGTDGVGTKLLIAQEAGVHDTIGVDLVAMCVNDIAVLGAEPLFFLDYFSTGQLKPEEGEAIVSGIAEGCKQAGCALLGGETAEMPGMYAPGHYDLAGFAVGVVERDAIKDGSTIQPGDAIIGLTSSGLHSNGYSLVRKILFQDSGLSLKHIPEGWTKTIGEELLTPTRIYIPEMQKLVTEFGFKGAAHITGGGIPGNVIRVLPADCQAIIDSTSWEMPPIFDLLRQLGSLTRQDLLETFNCGMGMMIVVDAADAEQACQAIGAVQIGHIVEGPRKVHVR